MIHDNSSGFGHMNGLVAEEAGGIVFRIFIFVFSFFWDCLISAFAWSVKKLMVKIVANITNDKTTKILSIQAFISIIFSFVLFRGKTYSNPKLS